MVSRRSLETATALLTGAFGAAVVISSRDNGIGWSAAGVDAGTFPFIVGLIILGGSVFNLVKGWPRNDYAVLRESELKRLGLLFVPAAIYVGVIPLAGMVVADPFCRAHCRKNNGPDCHIRQVASNGTERSAERRGIEP